MKKLTIPGLLCALCVVGMAGCKDKEEDKTKGGTTATATATAAAEKKLEYTGSRGWLDDDFADSKPSGGHANLDTGAPTCNAIVNAVLKCGNESMRTATARPAKVVAASTTQEGVNFRGWAKKLVGKDKAGAEKRCKALKADLLKEKKDCIKAVDKVLDPLETLKSP